MGLIWAISDLESRSYKDNFKKEQNLGICPQKAEFFSESHFQDGISRFFAINQRKKAANATNSKD